MLRALALSIAQLGDARIMAVFLKSLLVTLAIFLVIAAALWFGAHWLVTGWLGADASWGNLAGLAATLIALLAVWLLFRAVAIAVIGVFGDEVVHAVEARYYPQAAAEAREVSLGRSIRMGLGSAARAIAINLLLSPLYIILLVTGVGTAALFFIVNGWLLGRDLGEMVAARHMAEPAMRGWRRTTRWSRMATGLATTGLLVVPFVNLLAPVIGAAMATHIYHLRGRK